MKLWYLPLEHIDSRYTVLMDKQIRETLCQRGIEFEAIEGERLTDRIDNGAFLDSEDTNFFKASQIQNVARAFRSGRVHDGDKFFISDLWFPGLEAIPYMALFRKVHVEIWSIAHAGSWTDTDFVGELKDWVKFTEKGWFSLCSGVFVGSEFHRIDIVRKGRCSDIKKIHNTGLVFDTRDLLSQVPPPFEKRDLVVMAGRLDDEKQPWLFDELASHFPGVEFIKTYEKGLSKLEYFKLLSQAKVIFSAALQENFGYAVLEAATFGVTPVVPDRLAYTNIWPSDCRYSDMKEAVRLTEKFLKRPLNVTCVAEYYNGSFLRMLKIMGFLD